MFNNRAESYEAFYFHEYMDNVMQCYFTVEGDSSTKYVYEYKYTRINWIIPKLMSILFPSMYRKQGQKWIDQLKSLWRDIMTRDEVLIIYDELVENCERFTRKGKTMPYTSANGHMFSQLSKEGEIGMRFSKEVQSKYLESLKTNYYESYGTVMKGYILIPDELLSDTDSLKDLLNESYDYVMSLEPK